MFLNKKVLLVRLAAGIMERRNLLIQLLGSAEMSRRAKREAAVSALESELAARLRKVLPAVVVGSRTTIFTNREFNPHALLPAHYDSEADELLDLARRAQSLRQELEHPVNAGPGYLYLEACRESADLSDPHRLGPRRLAQRVLNALGTV